MAAATTPMAADESTRIIAHRGASAYLPEHTRAAYVLAYGQGADFLEPDLVLTADGVLVARHDATLEATTDVADVFPDRARADGRYYVIDFTLAELRRLNAGARVDPASGEPVWPDRWPPATGRFGIVTFGELVELTRQLNRSTGRRVGLYPELKFPARHREAGGDIVAALVDALDRHGLPDAGLPLMVQCFEAEPLRRLRQRYGSRIPLIRLIAQADTVAIPETLSRVAEYADGIGIAFDRLVEKGGGGRLRPTPLVGAAREAGLALHPYTFRRESMPEGVALETLLEWFIDELQVDALFTDHPDVAVRARR